MRTYGYHTDIDSIPRALYGFLGRFEDGNFSLKTKMKVCFIFYWKMKMWRTQNFPCWRMKIKNVPYRWRWRLHFDKFEDRRSLIKMWINWKPSCVQRAPYLTQLNIWHMYKCGLSWSNKIHILCSETKTSTDFITLGSVIDFPHVTSSINTQQGCF